MKGTNIVYIDTRHLTVTLTRIVHCMRNVTRTINNFTRNVYQHFISTLLVEVMIVKFMFPIIITAVIILVTKMTDSRRR